MEEVFKYIIGLGAAVMMPIIFTVLGLCIGIKFGRPQPLPTTRPWEHSSSPCASESTC